MVGKVQRLRQEACYAQHELDGEGFPLWRQQEALHYQRCFLFSLSHSVRTFAMFVFLPSTDQPPIEFFDDVDA